MKALFKLALGIMLLMCLTTTGWADQPTQFSTDGNIEAKLLKAQVREGVLTVNVALKNISEGLVEPEIRYGACYYIDIKDKTKYLPLKDSKGHWIAGPVTYGWSGGTFKEGIRPGSQRLFWIKFPAPKSGAKKVDLFIPNLLPFEGVELQ